MPPSEAKEASILVIPRNKSDHLSACRSRKRSVGRSGAAPLAAALLLAALAGGCSRSVPPPDTLVVGQVAEPRSLDPHVTTALNDFRILVNLYEGLVRYRPGTLDPEPALAESWQISDDGRVYSFRLREDVRFHDGSPFDADAVRFNFDRMRDPAHPHHDTGPFPLAFFFDAIESIDVPDPHTVRFVLDRPYAPFLSNLAYPTGLIVSPAAVRRWGADYGRHPSGTGSFRFVDWQAGQRVELARFDGYRGRPAAIETLIFRPVTDPMTRVAELMAGGIDVALELSPDNVAAFRGRDGFQVLERAGPHLWFLILNLRSPALQDARVRRALSLAIDRESLIRDVLRDTAVHAAGPVPAAFDWASDPTLAADRHDPERARRLLTEAGIENGLDLTLLVPRGGSGMLAPLAMATAIQGDLARVGVTLRLETYEWNTYLAKVNDGLNADADMAQMAWMTNDPDTLPSLALRCDAWPDRGGFNSGWYCNREADVLIKRAQRETARAARGALYRRLERLVHADAPWIVIGSWRQNIVTRAGIEGLRLEPSFYLLLDRARKTGAPSVGDRASPAVQR